MKFSEHWLRQHVKTDATRDAVEALHADVFRTSPVGNTLERPVALTVELA